VDNSHFPLTSALDCDLTVFAEVQSTNKYLTDHPGQPHRITVAVTDNQTAGRGRQNRQWSQPLGSGLALSVRLPVTSGNTWLGAFPLLAGGVVADVIGQETGLVASVKWPNDILIAGKKVCGILCETSDHGVIAGIGLNLAYPEGELPTPQATSLHLHTDIDQTLQDRLVAGIVTGLRDVVAAADGGNLATLLDAVSQKVVTIGQPVKVDFPDRSSRKGTATGIGPDGSLLLLWEGGSEGVVVAGDVWHLTSPA
jgi:BirA family biotin operon repressor/biotin-[acetyl-CoA-carboxylase] ligase